MKANKMYMLVTLLAAAALMTGCASSAFAQTGTPSDDSSKLPNRTLTVSGTGKIFITPDLAYVTIGVHTEGYEAGAIVSENTRSAQKVIDTLEGLGIAAKDIQTTNFSIYPQQEFDVSGKPTGKIKYIVDNSVLVTVRDLGKIGDVLDKSVQAGANSINGIQFDVENKSASQSAARKAAVEDAFAKAQELAQAAGVTLGEVQTINESTSSVPVPMYDMRAAAPVAQSSVPVEAGQMTLSVDVSIVYQIN